MGWGYTQMLQIKKADLPEGERKWGGVGNRRKQNWSKIWTALDGKGTYMDLKDQKSGPSERGVEMGGKGKQSCNRNRTAIDGMGIYIQMPSMDQKSGPSRRRMEMGWSGKQNWSKNWTALDGIGTYMDPKDQKSGPSERGVEMGGKGEIELQQKQDCPRWDGDIHRCCRSKKRTFQKEKGNRVEWEIELE